MVNRHEKQRAFRSCNGTCLAKLGSADRFAMGPKPGLPRDPPQQPNSAGLTVPREFQLRERCRRGSHKPPLLRP